MPLILNCPSLRSVIPFHKKTSVQSGKVTIVVLVTSTVVISLKIKINNYLNTDLSYTKGSRSVIESGVTRFIVPRGRQVSRWPILLQCDKYHNRRSM